MRSLGRLVRLGPAVLGLAFTLVAAPAAAATASDPDGPAKPTPAHDLALRVDTGVYTAIDRVAFGPIAGVSGFYRSGLLLVGGVVSGGLDVITTYDHARLFPVGNDRFVSFAPAAGVAIPTPAWARIEIVALLGVRYAWNVDSAIEYETDGASATLPFAGVHGYAGLQLGRFTLGVAPFLEGDVGRRAVSFPGRSTFQLDDVARQAAPGSDDYVITTTVGESRAGLTLSFGATLDR